MNDMPALAAAERTRRPIHVIPQDSDDDGSVCEDRDGGSNDKSIHAAIAENAPLAMTPPASRADDASVKTLRGLSDALDAMAHVGQLTRQIGSSVIKREAATVNKRLFDYQQVYGTRSKKRRTDPGDDDAAARTQDGMPSSRQYEPFEAAVQASIRNQACRTKRMSLLLMSMEATHQLLLEEIMACAADEVCDI